MKSCTQCGRCCLNYADGGLAAAPSDLEHWATHRSDISEYVRDGEIWFSPKTGNRLTRCPWLNETAGKYACGIYADRPEDCRSYPVLVEDMIKDECEMLEVKDRRDLAQAQACLDLLMHS